MVVTRITSADVGLVVGSPNAVEILDVEIVESGPSCEPVNCWDV